MGPLQQSATVTDTDTDSFYPLLRLGPEHRQAILERVQQKSILDTSRDAQVDCAERASSRSAQDATLGLPPLRTKLLPPKWSENLLAEFVRPVVKEREAVLGLPRLPRGLEPVGQGGWALRIAGRIPGPVPLQPVQADNLAAVRLDAVGLPEAVLG